METMPFSYAGLITVLVPFITAKVKQVLPNSARALAAPILGGLSSIVIALLGGFDVASAIAIGIGAGGLGSSGRDLIKDVRKK